MRHEVKVDISIIGGGIAGLWLLNRLQQAGYSAVLFEQGDLGSDQTIASQGMIHGGLKYALSGIINGSSEAVAEMPALWQRCLDGVGEVDLTKTKLLSKEFNMWSTGSAGSKLTSFFATRAMRGRINKLKRPDYPAVFQDKAFNGNVYRLLDIVLDVPSLLNNLKSNCPDRIFSIDWQQAQFEQQQDGKVSALEIKHGDDIIAVAAQHHVFTAGKGNGELMAMLNIQQPKMQIRPLQQVMVKHTNDFDLYAHCVDFSLSTSPRLTVSSHRSDDGSLTWYLGGDLATNGLNDSPEQLIDKAKKELNNLFPWLDFNDAQWTTIAVDRAEPKQSSLTKPDQAFAQVSDTAANVSVAWPTKLTLAPDLADKVIASLQKTALKPQPTANIEALSVLGSPVIAAKVWDKDFEH